jgi:cell division protein ZapE
MSILKTFSSYEGIEEDQSQKEVVDRLNLLQEEILEESNITKKFFSFLKPSKQKISGIYLWGDVGRGKTFLMDLFFESLEIKQKERKHFHRLMEDVHNGIRMHKNEVDPIQKVTKSICENYRIICIDEFYVEDVADAMIMSKLINSLLNHKIKIIMTSNSNPNDLYKKGLQRDLFMPAIHQINQQLEVIHIGEGKDYRLSNTSKGIEKIALHNEISLSDLNRLFGKINGSKHLSQSIINIRNRKIECISSSEKFAWFHFNSICGDNRSVKDYIEIADKYEIVIITEVPIFEEYSENEARRFIALIDELYDHNTDLFMTTVDDYNDLYHGKKLIEEFKRTTSRLAELNKKL